MTITATYDDTNGVVTLDVDDYGPLVEFITIERSTDNIVWTTVRGTVQLGIDGGSVTGVSDYEYTPCVENMYRAQAVPMGLYLPSVTGSYASTPDDAALDITGDIDLRVDATLDFWSGSTDGQALIAKWTDFSPTQNSYLFGTSTNGRIFIVWSTNGSNVNFQQSTEGVPFENNTRGAVRVVLDVSGEIIFYVSDTISGQWTQLGDPVPISSTSIFAGNRIVEVGTHSTGLNDFVQGGIIHAIEIRNGINGTVVADPDFTAQTHHDTSFVDSAGRTWSTNGTASIETEQGPASITTTTTKAWIKSVTRPFLNRSIDMSCGTAMGGQPLELLANTGPVRRTTRNAVFPIINRTFPVAVTDLSLGREWRLGLRTWTAAEHHLIDMLFASGDVLLIQVPCSDCAETFESGYVTAFDPAYNRHRRYRNRVVWEANVTEVAPPGPDIAYREATWATVLDQFGSWAAVLAAVPSWAALLALLPNPSEVIVE